MIAGEEGPDPGPESPTDPLATNPTASAEGERTEQKEAPAAPKERTGKGKKKGAWKRAALRIGFGLGIIGLIGVAGVAGTAAWLLTPGGQARLGREVEGLVSGLMHEGELSIGDLSTNLLTRVGVRDVELRDGSGRAVVRVERAEASLDLLALVGATVRVPHLDVQGVDADLRVDEDGSLDIVRMFATEPDPDAPPFEGLPVDLLFESIHLRDSRVRLSGPDLEPVMVEELELTGAFTGSGLRYDVRDIGLTGQLGGPLEGPLGVDGDFTWEGSGIDRLDLDARLRENRVAVRGHARALGELSAPPGTASDPDGVDLSLEVARLDLPDVDAFADAGLTGRVGGTLSLRGALDALAVEGRLSGQDDTRGRIALDGTLDARTPAWDTTVDVDGLRVDDLIASLTDPLPVQVKARIGGSGASWPDALTVEAEIVEGNTEFMGVEVARASGDVSVDQGIVTARNLAVGGPVGDVTGGATFDPESGALELDLHAERVDPATLRAFQVPAELDGSRATADVKVRVATYAEQLDVRIDGTGTVAPFTWTEAIRARRVRGDYTVTIAGTDVDVFANATATGIVAYGTEVERAASRDIVVAVRSDRVEAGGSISASTAVYPLIPEVVVADLGRGVEVEDGTGRWDVFVPIDPDSGAVDGEGMTVDVSLDLGAHQLLRYPGRSGRLTVAMRGNDVDVVAALDASSTRRLADVDVDLDLETLTFTFPTLQLAPEPRQTWTAAPGGGFRVTEDGNVRDLDLVMRSAKGEIAVTGDVGPTGEQDLRVEVFDLHLIALARLLPMWLDGLDGYAGAVIELDGTAAEPDLGVDIEVADVAWTMPVAEPTDDGPQRTTVVRGLGAQLQLDGGPERLSVDGTVNVDGVPLLELDVAAPIRVAFDDAGLDPHGDLRAKVRALPGGITRVGELLDTPLPIAGQLDGLLRVEGSPVAPVGKLTLDASFPVEALVDDISVSLVAEKLEGGDLTWTGRAREGETRRLTLSGEGHTEVDSILAYYLGTRSESPDWKRPSLYLDELKTALQLDDLPLRSIVLATGAPIDLAGNLSGRFTVDGSAFQPVLNGNLSVSDGRIGTVRLTRTRATVRGSERGYAIGATADLTQEVGREQELGALYIAGDVPLVIDLTEEVAAWARGPLDVSVDVDVPIAIAAAYDRGVGDAVGFVEVDGGVTGPIFDPEPSLAIRTSEGAALTYKPVGVHFRDLHADVVFDRHAVQVREVSAQTRPSRVRVDTAITGVLSGALRGGGEAVEEVGELFQGGGEQEAREAQRGSLLLTGNAHLQEWVVDELDLTAQLEQALLLGTSEQLLRMSTTKPVTVKGPLIQPRVRGSVSVDEANVFLDYARALGGSVTELDSRITVHRGATSSTTEEAESSVLDDVDIALDIDLGRATRGRLIMPLEAVQFLGATAEKLLQVDVRARLQSTEDVEFRQVPCRELRDGRMRVIPGREGSCGLYHPQVTGVVGIVEGEARVLRADFLLSDSKVSFLGGEVYNPNLDIHGEMDLEDQVIRLDIGGTAYDPEIAFSSTGGDQGQIFATLALGTSLDGLTAQQIASSVGMALLSTALSDVNLPSVTIDPRGRVQIGLAVGRSLFVELTAGGTPRPDENVFEAEVEYTVAKGLLITAGFGAYAIPFWSDVLLQRTFD